MNLKKQYSNNGYIKINNFLKEGVAVLPGFQGISENGDITTIGRGGSDATAVAIANSKNLDELKKYYNEKAKENLFENKFVISDLEKIFIKLVS